VVVLPRLFRSTARDETINPATKPFCACRAELLKRLLLTNPLTNAVPNRGSAKRGDGHMRSLSFIILALGFVLAGSSMAGSADGNLPGVGTFAYDGPTMAGASGVIVVAR
jgi:hypothetical protein